VLPISPLIAIPSCHLASFVSIASLIVLLFVITFNLYHLSIFTFMLILYLHFKAFSLLFQFEGVVLPISSLVVSPPLPLCKSCFSSILCCAHAPVLLLVFQQP
jgi:hypothetical protein